MGKEKPKESVIGELKTFLLHGTLLIIILFIGAVAFVMLYDKYVALPEAKKIVTKTNHLNTVLYISDELQKCSSGETTAMDGSLTCSELNAANVVAAAVIAKDDVMNAYETDKQAITSGGTNTSDSDVGYIRLSVSGENIIIKTCHTKPCTTMNQNSNTIAFQ